MLNMIRLWLRSNGKDIVIYNYQLENGSIGKISYSKSRNATKIDNTLDNQPRLYYQYLHRELMQMSKINYFPAQYVIAWY